MSTQSANSDPSPARNTGPVDPDVLAKAKTAKPDPGSGKGGDNNRGSVHDSEEDQVDHDAPARGALFPDEDAPEPNEPG
jgi:hypothetical protein